MLNVSSSILWDTSYAHLWLHMVTIHCRIQLHLCERRRQYKALKQASAHHMAVTALVVPLLSIGTVVGCSSVTGLSAVCHYVPV
jgi:hypothetical protein